MRAHPKAAITPCVATRCQTFALKEESRKLTQVRITPQKAAVRRWRAHRRVNIANRNGMDRYMTPFEVVPMIPVRLRFPSSVQLSE